MAKVNSLLINLKRNDRIEYYKRSIKINPENISAIYARASYFNKIGEYEKAIDHYNTAFEMDNLKNNQQRKNEILSLTCTKS